MRRKTPEYLDDLISILNASNQRAVHPAGGEDHLALTLAAGSDPLISLNYVTQELALGDVTAQSDFTAHTTNINAHHNRQHSITSASDHTVTGSALDVVGLTATNTLGILTPSSNPGAASSLLKSDASGDLTLVNMTLSGNLAVNGGNITATGDLTITPGATDFLKIDGYLRSSNYVADTTGWAITDDTGTAEFRSLTADAGIISGALDVGQDFTVGSNILFVDQSQSNIGINCAPDTQFALDINGNVRWQGYGVGKMALQIPDAMMICHFDGPLPYESDFTGVLTGHMGQIGTPSGGVLFRPGRFGKAVQICDAATNFVDNPSFEVNTTHWFTRTGNTLTRVTTRSRYGSVCAEVTVGTPSDGLLLWNGTSTVLNNAGTHVITAWIWVPSDWDGGNVAALPVNWTGSVVTSFDVVWTAASDPRETWFRVQTTFTADAGDLAGGACIYTTSLPTSGRKIYADAYQTTEGSVPTMYLDGSLGDGHSWSGTAHLSTSSRTAATLTYDSDVVASSGSISLWWQPANDAADQPSSYLFANGTLECYYDKATANIEFTDQTYTASSGALSFSAGDWVHVVCTYESSGIALYVDGVALDTSNYAGGTFSSLEIGNVSGNYQAEGLIDDLLTVDRVMDAAEIRAIYESNAPVFAETSSWSFTLPNNLVWADEDGLFMRDTDGNAMFGLIGVDGKSWAGIANDAGDMVIGNSGTDYIRWDASAGTLSIVGNGGGITNLNGGNIQTGTVTATQINVDTLSAISADMGTLTAGTVTGATVRTAASGARIEMNTSKIYGTDGTTTQWEALASDGKLTAGSGGVILDEDGITLDINAGTSAVSYIKWKHDDTPYSPAYTSSLYGYIHTNGGNTYGDFSIFVGNSLGSGPSFTMNSELDRLSLSADLAVVGGIALGVNSGVETGVLLIDEITSTPANPSSGAECKLYMKADKLILQYNDGGTVRYKYLDLTGTGATWTHTTTAP